MKTGFVPPSRAVHRDLIARDVRRSEERKALNVVPVGMGEDDEHVVQLPVLLVGQVLAAHTVSSLKTGEC